jgi:hypothetical protein
MDDASKQVRIQSDGTPQTSVVTTSDGRVLDLVAGARIDIDMDAVEAHLMFVVPVIDVHATVKRMSWECPLCQEVLHHACEGPNGHDSHTW